MPRNPPIFEQKPPTQPLVYAVNPRRPPIDMSQELARRLRHGEVDNWAELGEPAGPLRVTRRPGPIRSLPMDTVAVVAASDLLPSVRVLHVAGVDPLRNPRDYVPTTAALEAPGRVTTVTVVGDVMLGRGVGVQAALAGDPGHALRAMASRLRSADIAVGNLESTLSEAGAPTQDDAFAADPRVARGLRRVGFDALSLANNHVGDFGPAALVETVRRLRGEGLATFGAGRDSKQAWDPVIIRRHGVSFGFLGFNAIGETPDVEEGGPGAVSIAMPPRTGPLQIDQLRRFQAAVRRLDERADVVVVLPHWGTQYTHRPELIQHRVARALVRAGADVVAGGHPHWVQGAELVDDALVVHSLGNFVFDMDFMERTQEGLVLEMVFWGDELMGTDYVPYRIDPEFVTREVSWRAAAENLEGFWAFSGF